jgi:hypothetical protein
MLQCILLWRSNGKKQRNGGGHCLCPFHHHRHHHLQPLRGPTKMHKRQFGLPVLCRAWTGEEREHKERRRKKTSSRIRPVPRDSGARASIAKKAKTSADHHWIGRPAVLIFIVAVYMPPDKSTYPTGCRCCSRTICLRTRTFLPLPVAMGIQRRGDHEEKRRRIDGASAQLGD